MILVGSIHAIERSRMRQPQIIGLRGPYLRSNRSPTLMKSRITTPYPIVRRPVVSALIPPPCCISIRVTMSTPEVLLSMRLEIVAPVKVLFLKRRKSIKGPSFFFSSKIMNSIKNRMERPAKTSDFVLPQPHSEPLLTKS